MDGMGGWMDGMGGGGWMDIMGEWKDESLVVAYYRDLMTDQVVVRSFCTISENLRHDACAIYAHILPVLHEINKSSPIHYLHFLSDAPATQYRNKLMFYIFSNLLPKVFNLKYAEWSYSAPGHGKGAPDGVGGYTKRTADRIVAQGEDITNLETLFEVLCKEDSNITYMIVTDREIVEIDSIVPDNLKPISGTMNTYQIIWTKQEEDSVFLRRLSCAECDRVCSHYGIKKHTYERAIADEPLPGSSHEGHSEVPKDDIMTPCEKQPSSPDKPPSPDVTPMRDPIEGNWAVIKYLENHHLVFVNSGFSKPRQYRYWNPKTLGIDFDGMMEDLRAADENSVIILHACAHNPTGIDPTREQWEKIADIMEERKLFPFFDSAYQGFASGDPDKDAWPVRYFVQRGFEIFCAQSYAKNFGLYNERCGNLTIVSSTAAVVPMVKSQLTWIIRGMYSNPPAHGARVVATAFANPQLHKMWTDHIKAMSSRIQEMREALRSEIMKLGTPGTWDHIVKQIGLFSYTGLTQRQVEHLIQEYHIYLLKSGRINICGLNQNNVGYVAKAINDAVLKFPKEEQKQAKL